MNKFYILIYLILFLTVSIYAQNPEWINYGCTPITCTAVEGDDLWIGTNGGGLTKYNKITGERTFYTTSNSGIPDNVILSIAIDNEGIKWIGTSGGLAKFNGTDWVIYNTSNSGLPDNDVWAIAIDNEGNKWIGTYQSGLAKFNGTDWIVYNKSNSGLPDNEIYSLAIDGEGNKWIGTWNGLAKFDGQEWIVYNTANSGLLDNYIRTIAIDNEGNIWIGTNYGGLAK